MLSPIRQVSLSFNVFNLSPQPFAFNAEKDTIYIWENLFSMMTLHGGLIDWYWLIDWLIGRHLYLGEHAFDDDASWCSDWFLFNPIYCLNWKHERFCRFHRSLVYVVTVLDKDLCARTDQPILQQPILLHQPILQDRFCAHRSTYLVTTYLVASTYLAK